VVGERELEAKGGEKGTPIRQLTRPRVGQISTEVPTHETRAGMSLAASTALRFQTTMVWPGLLARHGDEYL